MSVDLTTKKIIIQNAKIKNMRIKFPLLHGVIVTNIQILVEAGINPFASIHSIGLEIQGFLIDTIPKEYFPIIWNEQLSHPTPIHLFGYKNLYLDFDFNKSVEHGLFPMLYAPERFIVVNLRAVDMIAESICLAYNTYDSPDDIFADRKLIFTQHLSPPIQILTESKHSTVVQHDLLKYNKLIIVPNKNLVHYDKMSKLMFYELMSSKCTLDAQTVIYEYLGSNNIKLNSSNLNYSFPIAISDDFDIKYFYKGGEIDFNVFTPKMDILYLKCISNNAQLCGFRGNMLVYENDTCILLFYS
jgi:hypothetical protein